MTSEDNRSDEGRYAQYVGPQMLDKAMHSLEGIIRGITCDHRVNSQEISALVSWIGRHQKYAGYHPFNEVIERVNLILADGVIDEEEAADLLWLCDRFTSEHEYFSDVSADIQRLHGLLGGIAADGRVSTVELESLRDWMSAHQHLRTRWPFDELDNLLVTVLADGVIDPEEHQLLLQFFNEFIVNVGHSAIEMPASKEPQLVHGLCAICPEIRFEGRTFCFTGKSKRMSRKQLEDSVVSVGGLFLPRVTQSLNYLIVGADGNPAWAYACYGRKVEQAIALRKSGQRLLIVHENDFWDCYQDFLSEDR